MSSECDIRFITLVFPIQKSREIALSGDIRFIALAVVNDLTLGQSQPQTVPVLGQVLDTMRFSASVALDHRSLASSLAES